MPNQVKEFNDYRAKMNDKILADNNKVIKRIFNLDCCYYLIMRKKHLKLVKRCGRDFIVPGLYPPPIPFSVVLRNGDKRTCSTTHLSANAVKR